jgi:tetratricopeptide (TPR) repeat protein
MTFRNALLLFTFLLGIPLLQAGAINTYYESLKVRKAGKTEQYYKMNLQLIKEAQAENLPYYEYTGAFHAASISYRQRRIDDCLAQVRLGIDIFEKHGHERNLSSPWVKATHASLWNLTERCHSMQMRPGEGWKAQQKASELWHNLNGLPYTRGEFDVVAIDQLKPNERANGWRHIGREASYLHDFGKTTEARSLLQKAIEQDRKSKRAPSLYSMQLRSTLAIIESFIGYKESSIKLVTQQIEQIKAVTGLTSNMSLLIARINRLGTRSDFEGASEELLKEAHAIVEEATAISPKGAAPFQRTINAIENQLASTAKGYEELEKLAKEALANGQALEAFYLNRNALFLRAQATDENLDSHFNDLLAKTRRTGVKRSEPRIYRQYGDWLSSQGRFGEAIVVYREALSLSRTSGWHPMVPRLYGRLGLTYQKAGQSAAADAIWQELEAYLNAHPDIPVQSILKGWAFQLSAYLTAGREVEASALIKRVRALESKGGLKPYWLEFFTDEAIASYREYLSKDAPATAQEAPAIAGLQPKSLHTVALPGTDASGVFHLINHGAAPIPGILRFTGPGAITAENHTLDEPSFQGDLGEAENTTKVPLTLAGGTFIAIPVTLPSHKNGSAQFTLRWTPKSGTPVTSTWSNSWGPKISEALILDSADLSATPFIGVPITHHVGFPKGHSPARSIRLKGPTPLRVEYRDPTTGDLLAVDANGNGRFDEEGEFALTTTKLTAPEISPKKNSRIGTVEIWLYPIPDHPWEKDMELRIELHDGSKWEEFATDLLKVSE